MTKHKYMDEWILLALYRILGSGSAYTNSLWTAESLSAIINFEYGLSELVKVGDVRRMVRRLKPMMGDGDFSLAWKDGCPNPHPSKRKAENIVPIQVTSRRVTKPGAEKGSPTAVLGWSSSSVGKCKVMHFDTKGKRGPRLKITEEEKARMVAGLAGGGGIREEGSEGDGRKRQATDDTNDGTDDGEGTPTGSKRQRRDAPTMTCRIAGVGTFAIDIESVPSDIIAFITTNGRLVEGNSGTSDAAAAISPTATATETANEDGSANS